MAVRLAGPSDRDALAALMRTFEGEFGNTIDPGLEERLDRLLVGSTTTFLLAGEPAFGFAALRLRDSYLTATPETHLDDLFVVPERRGEGHGRALLEGAIARARELGASHFELTTTEEDVEAAALYRSAGLRQTEEDEPGSGVVIWFGLDL